MLRQTSKKVLFFIIALYPITGYASSPAPHLEFGILSFLLSVIFLIFLLFKKKKYSYFISFLSSVGLGFLVFAAYFFSPLSQPSPNLSRVKQTKIMLHKINALIEGYFEFCGHYPKDISELSKKSSSSCMAWNESESKLFKIFPKDGWKKDFIYENKEEYFSLISYGSDGKRGGEGQAKDISLKDL